MRVGSKVGASAVLSPHSLDAYCGSPTTLAELEHTNALHSYLDYLCLVPYADTSTRLDCGGKAPIRSLDANCGHLSTLIRWRLEQTQADDFGLQLIELGLQLVELYLQLVELAPRWTAT